MKPATAFALISLVGLIILTLFHFDQRERLHSVQAENWALRGRLDRIANQLDQLKPFADLLGRPTTQSLSNPYGAAQVVGAPDADGSPGDSPRAWCPPQQYAGRPWLLLSYPPGADVAGLEVHANWNPGAIVEVSAVFPDGSTQVVWQATQAAQNHVAQLEFPSPVAAQQFKLSLDPSTIPGWNEIDAVRALYADGKGVWAMAAEASGAWQDSNETH